MKERVKRVVTTHVNIFGITVEIFFTNILSSNLILELLGELLASLHFLAYGLFQRTLAVGAALSQIRFSCVLSQVLKSLLRRMGRYIKFLQT